LGFAARKISGPDIPRAAGGGGDRRSKEEDSPQRHEDTKKKAEKQADWGMSEICFVLVSVGVSGN
jgi:hypothetical protein